MNKKYLSALVCGFGVAVLTTIPGIESVACCLLVPVAAGFSVGLYKKSHPDILTIRTATGVFLGLLTGVFAALFASGFEVILTYITRANDLIVAMPQSEKIIQDMNLGPAAEESLEILRQMVKEIQSTGFSLLYSVLITLANLITYTIFGMLGGTLGAAIINKRSS
ncbi:MAG: hypothetical protein WBQ32_02320 [Ignavibacteriaceae bacterium]